MRLYARGGITKTGNGHARRVLVEAAWAYRLRARITRALHLRLDGLPQPVREIAWKAQIRLCARYRRLFARGKAKKPTIVTAIARELAGFHLGYRPSSVQTGYETSKTKAIVGKEKNKKFLGFLQGRDHGQENPRSP